MTENIETNRRNLQTNQKHAIKEGRVRKPPSIKPKTRNKRYLAEVWKRWAPKIKEWYSKYNLQQTHELLLGEAAAEEFEPSERQLRHYCTKSLNLVKYKTPNNNTGHPNLKRGINKGFKNGKVPKKFYPLLSQLWQALGVEKMAFSLLASVCTPTSSSGEAKQATRMAIAMARTATQAGEKKRARARLIQLASGKKLSQPSDHLKYLTERHNRESVTHVYPYSAFYAYTYGRDGSKGEMDKDKREDGEGEGEEKLRGTEAAKMAAVSLRLLFDVDKSQGGLTPELMLPIHPDTVLGTQFDLLTYFALYYTLETSKDQPMIENSPLSQEQRDNILAKFLSLQPVVREMGKVNSSSSPCQGVVARCLGWIIEAFNSGQIVIPSTLREVECKPDNRIWRDEVELFVGIWSTYFEAQEEHGGDGDGWSKECENELAISPTELMTILLRCTTGEIPSLPPEPECPQFDVTAQAEQSRGRRSRSASSSVLPSPIWERELRDSTLAPVSGPAVSSLSPTGIGKGGVKGPDLHPGTICSQETIQRREKLVSQAAERFERLAAAGENEVWRQILDWFVEMNRLDDPDNERTSFKYAITHTIDQWIEQKIVPKYCSSSTAGSSSLGPEGSECMEEELLHYPSIFHDRDTIMQSEVSPDQQFLLAGLELDLTGISSSNSTVEMDMGMRSLDTLGHHDAIMGDFSTELPADSATGKHLDPSNWRYCNHY